MAAPPPPVFGFPFVIPGGLLTNNAIDFLTKIWNLATEGVQQPFYGFSAGVPASSQVLGSWLMTGVEAFPAGLAGTIGLVTTAATAAWSASLTVTGLATGTTTIGSANVAAGGTIMTWQLSLDYDAAEYDILSLVAPASADATLAGVYFTIVSMLT